MQILEVKDKPAVKAFQKLPHQIYKGDPNWIPPLEAMTDSAFDPQKNAFFKSYPQIGELV